MRYDSPEIDWDAGIVSRELFTTALAAAVLHASEITVTGTASTSGSFAGGVTAGAIR